MFGNQKNTGNQTLFIKNLLKNLKKLRYLLEKISEINYTIFMCECKVVFWGGHTTAGNAAILIVTIK